MTRTKKRAAKRAKKLAFEKRLKALRARRTGRLFRCPEPQLDLFF